MSDRTQGIRWLAAVCYVSTLLTQTELIAQVVLDHSGRKGSIEGVVTFSGDVPVSAVPDDAGERRKLLAVDRKSRGLRDVLAYLERSDAPGPDSPGPEARAPKSSPPRIIVDQIDHSFRPQLIAIREGQKVTFTNSDAANHNVRTIAFASKNQFNVYTAAGVEYSHEFIREKKLRPIALTCDLHPWMKGWIYVFDHPYFAVSDVHGKLHIRDVPQGTHRLEIRQPDVGYRKTLTLKVKQGEKTEVKVTISNEDLRVPLIPV